MDSNELKAILENHKHWLIRDCDGWENMRASLQDANLQGADLQGADLCRANLQGADLCSANLQGADLYGANLQGAYLQYVDLRDANLFDANLYDANMQGADMQGVDIDYSCLPLWCGSLGANFDSRQLKQIAYHLVKAGLNSTNATDEDRRELSKLIDYANGFHRAQECGLLKEIRR
jgi:uncharacterized protein YjbI with pentapeptide repeats